MKNNIPTPEADIDPTDILQGHNCQVQIFTLKRELKLLAPKINRVCREFLYKDQFDNYYLVYRAVLQDGNIYDVGDWVSDQAILRFGGFNDDCLDAFREKAFDTFRRTSEAINAMDFVKNGMTEKQVEIPSNLGGQ